MHCHAHGLEDDTCGEHSPLESLSVRDSVLP